MKLHGYVFADTENDYTATNFFKTFEECVDEAYERYKELFAESLECFDDNDAYCFDGCVDENGNGLLSKEEFVKLFRSTLAAVLPSEAYIQLAYGHIWCDYHVIEVEV